MKQNKLFLGLATLFAATFTFAACSSDDAETQNAQQDRTIRLTSSLEKGGTRATSDPQGSTSLSTSSSLGVFAINNSTAHTNGNNEEYSVDGSGNLTPTTEANKMTWPASGTVSFYAYAPRIDGATYNGTNSFSIKTDQTSTENYLASDLVLAKNENVAETSSAVQLSFNHLMAKINITIQKAANATVDLTHAKVSIINTNTATTFKPNAAGTNEDKVLGTASTPADITLFEGDGSAEPSTVVGIMVPQDIAAGSGLVKIQTYPGNATNRTLIAKVDELTTFLSGGQYSFSVTINDPEAPVTYITLKTGSTELVAWNDNNLGAATKEYSIGDYICSDGSVVKNADLASSGKTAIAVIFSNQVGAADAKWDGYAVSVSGPMTNKKWGGKGTLIGTAIAGSDNPTLLSNALADYSGLTTTTSVQAIEGYSTEYTAFDFGSYPDISGVNNLSGWFMPSFGQMVDLIQNLGEFSDIKTTIAGLTSTNNAQITTDLSFLSTINNHKPGSTDIIGSGVYATTSENSADNIWILNIGESNVQLSRQAGKDGTSRSVLPIIAFKVK